MARIHLTILMLLASPVWAQFDAKSEDENSEVTMEAGPSSPKLEVQDKDLKALEAAKANKSEESLIQAASRVLGVDANNLTALNTLGVFYFEQGRLGLARIIFLRALKSHPDIPALHNNLGVVYLAEGKQRLALTSFRKSLDLKSDYRIGAANLGSIYLEYKDFGRALGPLEAGYKTIKSELKSGNNNAVEVANNYAVALSGAGQNDDAREIYEEILKYNSRNPTVLLNYAILLVDRLKDYKEGGKVLSRIKFAVEDGKILKRVEELEDRINAGDKK